jgi:uncharacterized RDD family membrane protein YckC
MAGCFFGLFIVQSLNALQRAMAIEVRGPHRGTISFGRALGRNLGKIVSALPLYIGFLWAFISKSSNAWHDTFSNCGVYERR